MSNENVIEKETPTKVPEGSLPPKAEAPDKKAFTAKIDGLNDKIKELTLKRDSLRTQINEFHDKKDENEERKKGIEKTRVTITEYREKFAKLREERDVFRNELNTLKAERNQKIELSKKNRAKKNNNITVEEVRKRVAALEKKLENSSGNRLEERQILGEIKTLKASEGNAAAAAKLEESIKSLKAAMDVAFAKMQEKNAEMDNSKGEEKKLAEVLDNTFKKSKPEQARIKALFAERDSVRNDLNALYNELRETKKVNKEETDRFQTYIKAYRKLQNADMHKANNIARHRKRLENEIEPLQLVPFQKEMNLCESLRTYCKKMIGEREKVEAVAAPAPTETTLDRSTNVKNATVSASGKIDNVEDILGAFSGSGKRKKGKKNVSKKDATFSHSVTAVHDFGTLGLNPPPTKAEATKMIEVINEKLDAFKASSAQKKIDNEKEIETRKKTLEEKIAINDLSDISSDDEPVDSDDEM
eukprot:TRINITY_DN16816_c0_g1_i1.p1 TRINITY_DN16816_c0_g1~~TRINITY_DN16816_c0_g1_i1.p1  ORF type:complete len:474 (+),score=266.82 TRINITY_DN16816_c0_g1_i1:27-1448(+)